MNYSDSYNTLKTSFHPDLQEIRIDSSDCRIKQFRFSSTDRIADSLPSEPDNTFGILSGNKDAFFHENYEFSYPVFIPGGKGKFSRAIILLHGLNERSWIKYLPWAQRLADGLQRPVILFPISFHMNRSPSDWSNPRLMSAMLAGTRLKNHRNHSSTFANLALSLRLSRQPLRFFTSGSQSTSDLEKLITTIQSGKHPLFNKSAIVDFFAYSIGAFLAQIMMLTYGDQLLSESRLFMFCGGAPFSQMNGVSKLIMDEEAFLRLRFYYLRQFDREIRSTGTIAGLISKQPIGMAFRAMLDATHFSEWRTERFQKMEKRISAVALKNDKIIPPAGIAEILKPGQLEVMDCDSDYTHENPFPLTGNPVITDDSFEKVFSKAVEF